MKYSIYGGIFYGELRCSLKARYSSKKSDHIQGFRTSSLHKERKLYGGGFNNANFNIRCANRRHLPKHYCYNFVGFRTTLKGGNN